MADSSNIVDLQGKSPNLVLNKNFASNVVTRYHNFNEAQTERETKAHREFENLVRKQHTNKKLSRSEIGTLYSDLISEDNNAKDELCSLKKKKRIISPFQQVQKLVSDAAKFNDEHEEGDQLKKNQLVNSTNTNNAKAVVRKSRINVDKTMLRNYLKHTTVHNRIQEEEEMWEQYSTQKKRKISSLTSASAKKANSASGSMYADKEEYHGKKAKSSNIKQVNNFGKYTKKLLKAKEQDPNRWDNSGFKELYAHELKKSSKSLTKDLVQFSDEKSSDSEWEESVVRINKSNGNPKRKVFISDNDRNLDKRESDDEPLYVKTIQARDKKEKVSKNYGLQSNLKTNNKDKIKNNFVKSNHKDFESLKDQMNIEVTSTPQRIKSLAIVKPPNILIKECSSNVEINCDINKMDKSVKNDEKKHNRDNLQVSSDTLKNTIHGHSKKDKNRIVLKNKHKNGENIKTKLEESSFSDSSLSDSSLSDYSSSTDSSFSSSSSDEKYSKSKKLKKKSSKHKTTFSDYDSDCLPKK
ncbi:ankyrin repeat domain-containing protein 12 [Hydra vulgaris]|uniref:ankyrin repeat domain-containing protein 12 n=1 Tax=Hydra vulgaris TaxID=6087 RepID=UPI001F5F27A4|nr:ankyrin repeat domain-containing protein 12 [Hydra vulgaris]